MKVDIIDGEADITFASFNACVGVGRSCFDGMVELYATDQYDSSDGATLAPSECIEFGALLVRIGEAMKAGATAEEALRAVAGEGE